MKIHEDFEIDEKEKLVTYHEEDINDVAEWIMNNGWLEGWEAADIQDELYMKGDGNYYIGNIPYRFDCLVSIHDDEMDDRWCDDDMGFNPYMGCYDFGEELREGVEEGPSFPTEPFDSLSNGDKAWILGNILMYMNDEEAYYGGFLYIWPDGEEYDDILDDFADQEDYDELYKSFVRHYKASHKYGLFDAPEELVKYAHELDAKLGLKEIENIPYPTLGSHDKNEALKSEAVNDNLPRYNATSYVLTNYSYAMNEIDTDSFDEIQDFVMKQLEDGYDVVVLDRETGDKKMAYACDYKLEQEEAENALGESEQIDEAQRSPRFIDDELEDELVDYVQDKNVEQKEAQKEIQTAHSV